MCRTTRLAASATAALMSLAELHVTDARGGLTVPDVSSTAHIEQLPPEVRTGVFRAARACGGRITARHLFSRYIQDQISGERFIALHFEEMQCNNRAAICSAAGCLHQVYVSGGSRYRRVLEGYAGEIELRHIDGRAAVAVTPSYPLVGSVSILRWNGRAFASHSDLSAPQARWTGQRFSERGW